ncbi:MAG: hypothetical protein IJP79_00140 [Paludibacteraceae bacterium]|nr:hypothetical protein [Paludibacteraceae bacterium]
MNNLPDITPENHMLKLEHERLKKEFSSLMLTLEDMKQQSGPRLSALYTKLFGNKKYEILNLQVEIRILERRKQLLQYYINRDETPNLTLISETIDEIVDEYNKMLAEEAQKIVAAKQFLESPILNPEETTEIKAIYRMLVKHLHPDINPDLSEQEKELFLIAQIAYSQGDLEKLRELSLAIKAEKIGQGDKCHGEIQEYIDKLKEKINILKEKISGLEAMFPFTLKDKLADENWIKEEQKKDQDAIKELTEKRNHLAKIVEVMEEYKSTKQ